jgi:hypothetical protein
MLETIFQIGMAAAKAVMAAIASGDKTAIEQLRVVLKSPQELAALDEALIHLEHAKAERELGGK